MEVDYQLTREDLYAFQWRAAYLSADSRRFRRRSYVYLLVPLLVIGLLPSIGGSSPGIVVSLVFVLTVVPILAALYWMIHRRLLRRAILGLIEKERADGGQLGSHRIVLGDDAIIASTAVSETRTSWAGVDRVEQDTAYIYIYTSPLAALVIPKRAFTSSKADEFYALALGQKNRASRPT